MSDNGRDYFEARMLKMNVTANLRRYVTKPCEYRSKTTEAAWQTWLEAWQRASDEGRKLASEGRRIAYQKGREDGVAASTQGEATGCKGRNCGTTTGEHSPECVEDHAKACAPRKG